MSFGLDYERPKISSVYPESIEALRSRYIYLNGENFSQATPPPMAVFFDGMPATSFVFESENRLKVQVPAGLDAGTYEVQVRNGGNARLSNKIPILLYMPKPANTNYTAQVVDQQIQPLPPPFSSRKDSQRIGAASQYNGKLPDSDTGKWLGSAPPAIPTQGGMWRYAEDVIIQQFEFRSNGVEPGVGRTAGSGLFVKNRNTGAGVMYLDLSGAEVAAYGVAEHMVRDTPIHVKQGDEIIVLTFDATLEMMVTLDITIERPYL